MSKLEIENPNFAVAGQEIDVTSLPEKSVRALLSRGWTHYFGSEQASKVSGFKAKKAEEGVELAQDEIDSYKALCVEKALEALRSGNIGTRAAGVSIDPIDKLRNKIARQQVVDTLKRNNIKVPKGEETVKFPGGVEFTMAELVTRKLASNGEAIEAEAKKLMSARNKAIAALPVGDTPEALGF